MIGEQKKRGQRPRFRGAIAGAVQAEVITPVFASGDGAFMGIERPTVAVGTASYPGVCLPHRASVAGPYTDSTEAAQTDSTFVANSSRTGEACRPSFAYRASDAARFAGLDASLQAGIERRASQRRWTIKRSPARMAC